MKLAALALLAVPAAAQNPLWIRSLGTSGEDVLNAVMPDGAGGALVAGYTGGSLGGPSAGLNDAWLARYDGSGNPTWIRQLGTSSGDSAHCIAPDGLGGLYVGGQSKGNLGGPNAGAADAWFARYDAAGNQQWIRQIGSSANDHTYGAAPDGAGGLYVGGYTWGDLAAPNAGLADAWLARYDAAGNQTWIRQFGSSGTDFGLAAAPDGGGGAYLVGQTDGSLGGPIAGLQDGWLTHYDSAGNQLWVRQLGLSSNDTAYGAAPDGSGGVYWCGWTDGSLAGPNAGFFDAWFARYDSAGNPLWVRQLGTNHYDYGRACSLDDAGGVHLAGFTQGSLGAPSAGSNDAWLARCDESGNLTWLRQVGTSGSDAPVAVAPDGSGGVYWGGESDFGLGGANAGGADAWLARYDGPVTSTFCTAGTTTNGCVPSISGTGTPSASAASGFTIAVANVEGQKQGLIFYGVNNSGYSPIPWGASTSYMCVKSPVQRTPSQNSAGSFNACDGSLALDWNAFRAAHPTALGTPFSVGQHVLSQAWFRDPPSPKTTMLSNALQFFVQP